MGQYHDPEHHILNWIPSRGVGSSREFWTYESGPDRVRRSPAYTQWIATLLRAYTDPDPFFQEPQLFGFRSVIDFPERAFFSVRGWKILVEW